MRKLFKFWWGNHFGRIYLPVIPLIIGIVIAHQANNKIVEYVGDIIISLSAIAGWIGFHSIFWEPIPELPQDKKDESEVK